MLVGLGERPLPLPDCGIARSVEPNGVPTRAKAAREGLLLAGRRDSWRQLLALQSQIGDQVDGNSLSVALSERFSAPRAFDKWPTRSPFNL
jgi:hypothetical protein